MSKHRAHKLRMAEQARKFDRRYFKQESRRLRGLLDQTFAEDNIRAELKGHMLYAEEQLRNLARR